MMRSLKRPVILLSWLGLALLVAAVFFCLWQNRDTPARQFERRLQALYQTNSVKSLQVQTRGEARRLLSDMGTNAIPLLVQWLQWEPINSPRMAVAYNWEIWARFPHLQDAIWDMEGARRAHAAAWAFELLGTNAAMAAPELQKLTNSTDATEQTAYRAQDCLRLVTGPPQGQ